MEVILLHLPTQEEGEEWVPSSADEMRGHPPSAPSATEYMAIMMSKSNKGWHALWFYMKNDIVTILPVFFGHLIEEAPPVEGWGPIKKDKRRIDDLIDAIPVLNQNGLRGSSIIKAYHTRRVALLMACILPLYSMGPGA
jgi:hypothetical protein